MSRNKIINEYKSNGFKNYQDTFKKFKLASTELKTVDDLIDFILKNFTDIFRAMFFIFYILASGLSDTCGWSILAKSKKSTIFSEIFTGAMNFYKFDIQGNFNIINVDNEVRVY